MRSHPDSAWWAPPAWVDDLDAWWRAVREVVALTGEVFGDDLARHLWRLERLLDAGGVPLDERRAAVAEIERLRGAPRVPRPPEPDWSWR